MEYSGLLVEQSNSIGAETQAQAVATRRAQRKASKAKRAEEAETLKRKVRLFSPSKKAF